MDPEDVTMKTPCRDDPPSARADAAASRPAGARESPAWPEALAERVAGEMSAAWRRGSFAPAEAFLARHPALQGHPEAAARVIYEEICLREGLGQGPVSAEILDRFPQWRAELKMLLACHGVARPRPDLPPLPRVGESLGDFRLRAVLGRGRRGCVFLATQGTLADRPVVLKITRRGGGEHLSLARLQHPHVMPLYAVHDFPDRDLRALCMPYLGGLTLDRALDRLAGRPPAGRTGADFLRLLDEARTELIALPAWSATRQFLAGATYPRAVCWFGACLAEALRAAHGRGLLHLDLKPSNVLIADDGQPLLLDFHLARGPLAPGDPRGDLLGGTAGYMSPEQESAMEALREGRAVPGPLDARSDVYSLGVTLFEALAGEPAPGPGAPAAFVQKACPRAGAGLAAIVARCLVADPSDRYPDAAALAVDLRRHLGYRPPHGVGRPPRLVHWLARRFTTWRARLTRPADLGPGFRARLERRGPAGE